MFEGRVKFLILPGVKYCGSEKTSGLIGQVDLGGGRKKRAELRSAQRALTWLGMRLKVPVTGKKSGDEMLRVAVRVFQRNRTNRGEYEHH